VRTFLLRAYEIKRNTNGYVKMPCKWLSPLGNLEGICLPVPFEREGEYIWEPFLDSDDVEILSLGAIWNFGKGTGLS
jgi:hypothetical protein